MVCFLLYTLTGFAYLLGCGSELFFVCSQFTPFGSHVEPSEKLNFRRYKLIRNPTFIIQNCLCFSWSK